MGIEKKLAAVSFPLGSSLQLFQDYVVFLLDGERIYKSSAREWINSIVCQAEKQSFPKRFF